VRTIRSVRVVILVRIAGWVSDIDRPSKAQATIQAVKVAGVVGKDVLVSVHHIVTVLTVSILVGAVNLAQAIVRQLLVRSLDGMHPLGSLVAFDLLRLLQDELAVVRTLHTRKVLVVAITLV